MFDAQKTLASKVVFTGKGLHSGRVVRLEVLPAPVNHGIVFQRVDENAAVPLRAHAHNVTSTELCTRLGSGMSSVSTVEHIMAAFAGLGIDNAVVRLNAPEVPIMDGSARPFVSEFLKTGFTEQDAGREFLVVKKAIEFRDGDSFIRITPSSSIKYSCTVNYENTIIGKQHLDFTWSEVEFLRLADARTFCHLNEVNAMRSVGLAKGGSLDNAIVITDEGVLNDEGLRSENEFVKHKLLDCIGDLALLGGPLVGHVSVERPGHGFHAKFMNYLLENFDEYVSVVAAEKFEYAGQPAFAYVAGVVY